MFLVKTCFLTLGFAHVAKSLNWPVFPVDDDDYSTCEESVMLMTGQPSNRRRYVGNVQCYSTDLEIPYELDDDDDLLEWEQIVFIRIPNVSLDAASLPYGGNIARLVFDVDEADNAPNQMDVTVRIYGELSSNSSLGNESVLNGISSRVKTVAFVDWSPENHTETHKLSYTPDISSIVSEIVGQPQWTPGNAMAFLINRVSGNGTRHLEASRDDSGEAENLNYTTIVGGGNGRTPALEVRPCNTIPDHPGCQTTTSTSTPTPVEPEPDFTTSVESETTTSVESETTTSVESETTTSVESETTTTSVGSIDFTLEFSVDLQNVSLIANEAALLAHIRAGILAVSPNAQVQVVIHSSIVTVVFGGFSEVNHDEIISAYANMTGLSLNQIVVNNKTHTSASSNGRRMAEDVYVLATIENTGNTDVFTESHRVIAQNSVAALVNSLKNVNPSTYANIVLTLLNAPTVKVVATTVVTGAQAQLGISDIATSVGSSIPGGAQLIATLPTGTPTSGTTGPHFTSGNEFENDNSAIAPAGMTIFWAVILVFAMK